MHWRRWGRGRRRLHLGFSNRWAGSLRIIAVANQKGGVGKTTTAVNLSAALAKEGARVLLVDNDPQGNASSGLGIVDRNRRPSTYDVLIRGLPVFRAIHRAAPDANLEVVPANRDLVGAELELVGVRDRETILRGALGPVTGDYAFVLVDCPPSLGLLTLNAFAAADSLIVPIQCEYYALEGVAQLMSTVELVRRRLNPGLEIEGVLLTMHDSRLRLARQIVADAKGHARGREDFDVFRTMIPRNVSIAEAPSFGKSVLDYDPESAGAQAYVALARELQARRAQARAAVNGEGKR